MKTRLFPITAIAPLALLAACGSETNDAAPSGGSEAEAPTTAAKADAGPPAVDDVTTKDGTELVNFTGDASKGKRVFQQCMSCHAVVPGQNRVGPTLAGIMGQAAGAVDGYNYTDANAQSGITWTPEKMFQYLEDPRRVIPKTKMAYSGLRDPQDRADVIAYLTDPSE